MPFAWRKQKLSLRQRFITLGIIILLLGGVFLFYRQLADIKNFKLYYLKSYFSSFGLSGSETSTSTEPARSMPVLLYHSIVKGKDSDNVSLDNFIKQMRALKKAGYYTVSVADLDAFLRGEKEFVGKPFVLTFDDGAKDSYYPVDPILDALNYKAATFIITRFSVLTAKHNYYLPLEKLKQMRDSGHWEILSHGRDDHVLYVIDEKGTKHHFLSNKLWLADEKRIENEEEFRERVTNDLLLSKQDLEKSLGIEVKYFAYPFGDFGLESWNYPDAVNIIDKTVHEIYDRTFYQVWEDGEYTHNYPEYNKPWLKRLAIKPDWTAENLVEILEQGRVKQLSYRDDFSVDRGWRQTWGIVKFSENGLVLKADVDTTGAATFLDGTLGWIDYRVRVILEWSLGQSISLMARFQDTSNYTACTYSGNSVLIEERQNDQSVIKAQKLVDGGFNRKMLEAGIRVKENKFECLLADKAVVSVESSAMSATGGVGFKLWDPKKNSGEVRVEELTVEEL